MDAKFRVLQNASMAAGNGSTIFVAGSDEAAVTIHGISTDFSLKFQVSLDGTNWVDTVAYKTADPDISEVSTSALNEGWDLDVARWNYFRCKLVSIANGNVTVLCNIADIT